MLILPLLMLQFQACKCLDLNTFGSCDLLESCENVKPSCRFNLLPLYSLGIKNRVVGLIVLDGNLINHFQSSELALFIVLLGL